MPIPIAMLESSAVVVLSGMLNNPIIPKLIKAVIIIGTEPINPARKFLNITVRRMITNRREIPRLRGLQKGLSSADPEGKAVALEELADGGSIHER